MRLNARRGSEQYQAMNWSMAYSYTRREAVEHCPLTMIQVRQSKQPATIIRLNFVLAHGDGLLMPQHGITAD